MLDSLIEQFCEPDIDHFVIEGRWCVEALLSSQAFETVAVLRAEGTHGDFDVSSLAPETFYEMPREQLSNSMGYKFNRGLVALAKRPPVADLKEISGLWVACIDLADESNLGAIVRTSAALGVAGVLVPCLKGADVYSRKSIRASSGAVFRIPIHECPDLKTEILTLKENGFSVLGTALDEDSLNLADVSNFENGIVVFGPEKGGLAPDFLDICGVKLKIPMANDVDSLNVGACAAIVLYQLSTGSRT